MKFGSSEHLWLQALLVLIDKHDAQIFGSCRASVGPLPLVSHAEFRVNVSCLSYFLFKDNLPPSCCEVISLRAFCPLIFFFVLALKQWSTARRTTTTQLSSRCWLPGPRKRTRRKFSIICWKNMTRSWDQTLGVRLNWHLWTKNIKNL